MDTHFISKEGNILLDDVNYGIFSAEITNCLMLAVGNPGEIRSEPVAIVFGLKSVCKVQSRSSVLEILYYLSYYHLEDRHSRIVNGYCQGSFRNHHLAMQGPKNSNVFHLRQGSPQCFTGANQ